MTGRLANFFLLLLSSFTANVCRIPNVVAFHVGSPTEYRCRYRFLPTGNTGNIQVTLGGEGSVDEDTDSTTADDGDGDGWSPEETTIPPIKGIEKAWRYAKKPLLSIGSKGASASHGNSLRQLLESHTAVKVKVVNTAVFKTNTLEGAFAQLRDLAVQSGAPADMELLHVRASDRVLLIALPGTRARIESGDFPPEPVVWNKPTD